MSDPGPERAEGIKQELESIVGPIGKPETVPV